MAPTSHNKRYSADEIATLFFDGTYESRWLSEKQANWLLGQWTREAPAEIAAAANAKALRSGAVYGSVSHNGQFIGTWTLKIFKRSARLEYEPSLPQEVQHG